MLVEKLEMQLNIKIKIHTKYIIQELHEINTKLYSKSNFQMLLVQHVGQYTINVSNFIKFRTTSQKEA